MKIMPFSKYRLLAYEMEPLQALNANGWGYELTIEEWTWWGLKKQIKKVKMLCPDNVDPDKFWQPKLNLWVIRGKVQPIVEVNAQGKLEVNEEKAKLAILAPGVAGKPEREHPCINCESGEYEFMSTDPGGISRYECTDCGHQVTFP